MPYSPASFPAAGRTDPFSSQYLVSYCRDVEGLSRRRYSSLVPVRRNNKWTILLRSPLAPLESIHSLVYPSLTFLILNSIESNSRQDLGVETDPVSKPNESRGDRQGYKDAEDRQGWLERIKKTAHEQ